MIAALGLILKPVGAFLWAIMRITLPIPLGLIAGVFLLTWVLWSTSIGLAVRDAVKDYRVQFVNEAEQSALKAELKSEKDLVESLRISLQMQKQRTARDTEALEKLQAEKRMTEVKAQDQEDELQEILLSRTFEVPTVGQLGVGPRLRNK